MLICKYYNCKLRKLCRNYNEDLARVMGIKLEEHHVIVCVLDVATFVLGYTVKKGIRGKPYDLGR